MSRPSVVIVSPALPGANNGNWQTAHRWASFLAGSCDVRTVNKWPDERAGGDSVMLALHARRSAEAIAAWAQERGSPGLGVVLTGTDLYRDIAFDPAARRSLELAGRLVVLQELGVLALPEALRAKARVIYQSVSARSLLCALGKGLRAETDW